MTSRRAGYDSLVRRHQLENLLARSFGENQHDNADVPVDDSVSKGRDKTPVDVNSGVQREYGNEDIGRIASAIEETVPWSSGLFDMIWKKKVDLTSETVALDDGPRVERPRPRPEKKATDLTEVTEAYEAHMEAERLRLQIEKEKEERRRIEEKDKADRRREQEAMERSIEFANTMERLRAMFFGRPSQQIRLLKRDCQIERNKAEHYCSLWMHLRDDSEHELHLQEEIIARAARQKGEAAARAHSLRGKEKGARQAAAYLKGCQLLDASEASSRAADQYGAEAAEEEQKARIARAELEDAEENKLIEIEKINACDVQIKYNQKLAKKSLEEAVQREREEIRAVIEEEDRLIKARPTFDKLLEESPALSSTAKSYQDDVDKIDRRLAIIAMEQEMFRPTYLHVTDLNFIGKRTHSNVNIFIASRSPTKKNIEVHEKEFEWRQAKQTPGTVCLGRRGVEESGLLSLRSVVVSKPNEFRNLFKNEETFTGMTESIPLSGNRKKWTQLIHDKKLFEEANAALKEDLQEKWRMLGQENLAELQKHVVIMSDYFAKDDMFIPRANIKSKKATKLLDKKLFGRIWDERTCINARKRLHLATKASHIVAQLEEEQESSRHELPELGAIVQLDRVTVRLRHEPQHLWLMSYALSGKPALSVLNSSSFLGPKLFGYRPVLVPKLDPLDDPALGIDDGDGRPRRYGVVWELKAKMDDFVKEGDELIVLRVFDERKMNTTMRNTGDSKRKGKKADPAEPGTSAGGKGEPAAAPWEDPPVTIVAPASGKFTGLCPAVWRQKEHGLKERAERGLFDWNQPKPHGFLTHEWLRGEGPRGGGDVLRTHNLRVFSFEKVAFIEQGEEHWDHRVLPVAEWPDFFFKDFKHFFVR